MCVALAAVEAAVAWYSCQVWAAAAVSAAVDLVAAASAVVVVGLVAAVLVALGKRLLFAGLSLELSSNLLTIFQAQYLLIIVY